MTSTTQELTQPEVWQELCPVIRALYSEDGLRRFSREHAQIYWAPIIRDRIVQLGRTDILEKISQSVSGQESAIRRALAQLARDAVGELTILGGH